MCAGEREGVCVSECSAVVTELLASNLYLLFIQLHGVEVRVGGTLVRLFLCHVEREG